MLPSHSRYRATPLTSPASTAEAAVAAHLATVPGATVVAGTPNRFTSPLTLVVEAQEVSWRPYRWIVSVTVTAHARYSQPSKGDEAVTTAMDTVIVAMASFDATDAHWLGAADDLNYGTAEAETVDGTKFAVTQLEAQVIVPRHDTREVGPSEQVVRDLITAGSDLPVVNGSDLPPFVTTRWGGTADEDPSSDLIMVVVATPHESGRIEEQARGIWKLLYDSKTVVPLDTVSVDLQGTPPGSDGIHETAEIMCRVLVLHGG